MPNHDGADDYHVGYGKPPKHSQFRKGTSGNKKGRSKGSKNFATLFHSELNRRVPIAENGQRRTITKLEAAVKQLVNKAATGDAKAMHFLMKLSKELGDLKLPDSVDTESEVIRTTINIFDRDLTTGALRLVKTVSHNDES